MAAWIEGGTRIDPPEGTSYGSSILQAPPVIKISKLSKRSLSDLLFLAKVVASAGRMFGRRGFVTSIEQATPERNCLDIEWTVVGGEGRPVGGFSATRIELETRRIRWLGGRFEKIDPFSLDDMKAADPSCSKNLSIEIHEWAKLLRIRLGLRMSRGVTLALAVALYEAGARPRVSAAIAFMTGEVNFWDAQKCIDQSFRFSLPQEAGLYLGAPYSPSEHEEISSSLANFLRTSRLPGTNSILRNRAACLFGR